MRRPLHERPSIRSPLVSFLYEEIRHRTCEDSRGLLPTQRILKGGLAPHNDSRIFTKTPLVSIHITVITSRRYVPATAPRIPGMVRPFNIRCKSHKVLRAPTFHPILSCIAPFGNRQMTHQSLRTAARGAGGIAPCGRSRPRHSGADKTRGRRGRACGRRHTPS